MPTVASVAARIQKEGEFVTFMSADGSKTTSVKAFVRGYLANQIVNQLVAGVLQGDRVLHVVPADLSWIPVKPDRVSIGSSVAVVQSVETRTLRGVPCMHIIQVRGE